MAARKKVVRWGSLPFTRREVKRLVDCFFILHTLPQSTLRRLGRPLADYIRDLESRAARADVQLRPHRVHTEYTLGCQECLDELIKISESYRQLRLRLRSKS